MVLCNLQRFNLYNLKNGTLAIITPFTVLLPFISCFSPLAVFLSPLLLPFPPFLPQIYSYFLMSWVYQFFKHSFALIASSCKLSCRLVIKRKALLKIRSHLADIADIARVSHVIQETPSSEWDCHQFTNFLGWHWWSETLLAWQYSR